MSEPGRRLAAVMFTDMVGYTTLFQANERDALARRGAYVAAVERAHEAHGGSIAAWLGDGTVSTFSSAVEAVEAGVELQRELVGAGVDVRVGLHAGEVIDDGVTILGDAVNIASRVESFAVPGGVLVSEELAELIRNRPDLRLVSLGRFRLKNVGRPLELLAVVDDGIQVPDAATLEGKGERYASLPTRLPAPVGALLGREDDVVALVDAVRTHRLVTVTGPGGVGKTRVMVELGHRLLSDFLDGVAFVNLADVGEPRSFLDALAESLDVKEAEGRTLRDGIVALIGSREALLLLDNFEQLVDAAPEVASLLAACEGLRVVATSRTPLRLAIEHEFVLEPLALPGADVTDVMALGASPAVALFAQRARTGAGPLVLDAASAPVVASICHRLDGLPLAIELAAARLRLLSLEALHERLGRALEVLRSSSRDVPARQQTLRATIDWSHGLLDAPEQLLFRRLSVFAGGCTIEAVEEVCADDGAPVLDHLESLVDKALVRVSADGRVTMLQTIAEYATERLVAVGEQGAVAARHARAYAQVATQVSERFEGTEQVAAMEQGILEEQNLQVALDTLLIAARAGDAGAARLGLRTCGNLTMYWHVRGKNLTAREVSLAFLEAANGLAPPEDTTGALRSAALGAWALGQLDVASREWEAARTIAAGAGDRVGECLGDLFWSFAMFGADNERGVRIATRAATQARELGLVWAEGIALTAQGMLHLVGGDHDQAEPLLREGLAIQERIGDFEGMGLSVGSLAAIAATSGHTPLALALYDRALGAFGRIGDRAEEARILAEIAAVLLESGNVDAARERFCDSIRAYSDVGSIRGVGMSLFGLAAVTALQGRDEAAISIAAAAERYAHEEGIVNAYAVDSPGIGFVVAARDRLDHGTRELAEVAGGAFTIDEAIELARAKAR